MESLDRRSELEDIKDGLLLVNNLCTIHDICKSEGTNQRTLDTIELMYPGYVKLLRGCKSTESILVGTANVIRKIFELIFETIKRITRLILSLISDRHSKLMKVKNDVDRIKNIKGDIEIKSDNPLARGQLESMFKTVIPYELFMSRFKAAQALEKKVRDINLEDFYSAANSVKETAKDHALHLVFPEKDLYASIGIKYDSDFSKMTFEPIMETESYKKENIYTLDKVKEIIIDYSKFTDLCDNIYNLNKDIISTMEKCKNFGQKVEDEIQHIDKADTNKINKIKGAANSIQEIIFICDYISSFTLKDLAKIEMLCGTVATFVETNRRKIK